MQRNTEQRWGAAAAAGGSSVRPGAGSPLSGPSPGGVSGLEVLLHSRRCLPLSFPYFWNSHR